MYVQAFYVSLYLYVEFLNNKLGRGSRPHRPRHHNGIHVCLFSPRSSSNLVSTSLQQYVIKKNKEEIEEEMKKGKKAKDLNECNKEYMSKLNFNEARMIFLLKSNMIETKANFKGQFINNLKCEICGKKKTLSTFLNVKGTLI